MFIHDLCSADVKRGVVEQLKESTPLRLTAVHRVDETYIALTEPADCRSERPSPWQVLAVP